MGLEEALQSAGGFGRYQVIHIICILVTCFTTVMWNNLSIIFQGYGNSHHCMVTSNASKTEMIPREIGPDGSERLSQCEIYTYPGSNVTQPCPAGWVYDREYFDEKGTLTMEWDLVCGKKNYVETVITIRTVGSALGCIVMGSLGDMLGRRRALFIALLLLNVLSIGAAFSPNFITFCVLIFFRGFVGSGITTYGAVLSSELCPRTLYAVAVVFLGLAAAVGQMTLVLFAYLLRNWRHLQLGFSGVSSLYLLYYWWCPESVRWYMSKGRILEAKLMLHRQTKINFCSAKKELPYDTKTVCNVVQTVVPNDICASQNSSKNAVNFSWPPETSIAISNQHGRNREKVVSSDFKEGELDEKLKNNNSSQWKIVKEFLRTPRLLAVVGVLSYFSFVQRFNQFGLLLLQSNMSGTIYIKFFVNAASGIPGTFLAIFMMRRFGRKLSSQVFHFMISFHFFVSSIFAYLGTSFSHLTDVSTWFAVTAKPYIVAQSCTNTIFSQELSPTLVRSTSVSFQAAFGFTGAILAPFIAISVTRISAWLPSALFTLIPLVSVFLTYFLPETLGRGLPTSTQQILNYPLNLTEEEKKEVRETHKRELLFGQENKGFVRDEKKENNRYHMFEETIDSTYL